MPLVTIPDSESAVLRAGRSGRAYTITLAHPTGPAPEDGYPVLYLLDGHKFFGTLVEAVRARCHRPSATGVVPAIIVGIGPEAGEAASRTLDYTPGPQSDGGDDSETGGAVDFRAFIENELKPWVGARVAVDRNHQVLIGHSLGGYFVLDTLVTRPESFHAYVAISPSIWWDRTRLFDGAAALLRRAAGEAGRRRVMVTVGEYEEPPEDPNADLRGTGDRHRQRRMIGNARDVAERLGGIPGLNMRFQELAGEDHAWTVPVTLSRSLRFVLAPR